MKITQYKQYFIEDDENGTVRLLDIDATTIKLFPNVLAAKMWVELNSEDWENNCEKSDN